MSLSFDALDDFYAALEEVQILCSSAAKNVRNDRYYKAINKSAVLLLTSKFESFLENILDEYLSVVNSLEPSVKKVPFSYKLYHTFPVLDMICEQKGLSHKHPSIIQELEHLSKVWVSKDEKCPELNISFDFNYGKHGEKEVVRLFNKIGIADIFSEIAIWETTGSIRKQVDMKGRFNSITNIRNNIIHADANPSLTHSQIRQYYRSFRKMAKAIAKKLNRCLIDLS